MTAELAPLVATLRALSPLGAIVGARPVTVDDIAALQPAEITLVASAVATRRAEFATGRALLHELLGVTTPIGRRSNGAPDAPAGWSVSLAHDREVAVVVATEAGGTLGVDLEPVSADVRGLETAVCRTDDVVDDPLQAFVVKEAVYKAWSRPDRPIIDFTDVRIEVASDGTFRAEVSVDGVTASGRWATVLGRHVAVATLASPDQLSSR